MSEYDYRPERKKNRNHPVLTAALAGTLGLGGGFAGGYLANRTFAKNSSVIYTSTETGTSPQTTANSTATGMTVTDVAAKASPSVVEIITEVTLPPKCTPRELSICFIHGKGLYAVALDPDCATYEGKNPELAMLCEGPVSFKSWEDMTDFFLRMEVM